jgi:hypothetical protein
VIIPSAPGSPVRRKGIFRAQNDAEIILLFKNFSDNSPKSPYFDNQRFFRGEKYQQI